MPRAVADGPTGEGVADLADDAFVPPPQAVNCHALGPQRPGDAERQPDGLLGAENMSCKLPGLSSHIMVPK